MTSFVRRLATRLGLVSAPTQPSAVYWLVTIMRPEGDVLALRPVLAPTAEQAIQTAGDAYGYDGEYHAAAWQSALSVPITIQGGARTVADAAAAVERARADEAAAAEARAEQYRQAAKKARGGLKVVSKTQKAQKEQSC